MKKAHSLPLSSGHFFPSFASHLSSGLGFYTLDVQSSIAQHIREFSVKRHPGFGGDLSRLEGDVDRATHRSQNGTKWPEVAGGKNKIVGSTVRDVGNSVYSIVNKGSYIRICRRRRLASNLDDKIYTDLDFFIDFKMIDITYAVGYQDPSHFSRAFRRLADRRHANSGQHGSKTSEAAHDRCPDHRRDPSRAFTPDAGAP